MRRAATLLLLSACAGSAARAPAAAPPPDTAAFPPGVPWLSPGERTVYRVTLHDVDVATYTVVCGEVTELDGRPVVVVEGAVQSSPLVSLVREVDDRFTSWIDAETSRTVRFRAVERADPDSDAHESIEADAARVTDGTFAIRVRRGDGDERVERQAVGPLPLFDLNDMMIALRGWTVPVGTIGTADAIRSRYLWRTTVTMAGTEEVSTELGPLPAVRMEGESRRLARDGTVDASIRPRRYRLWISDDADRVPLRVVATTDYGDVIMDLVEYAPGGHRLGT